MSKKENLYAEIHIIQNVPPSCINRDDTGSPKTAEYGGVVRARVSSQAWKHAMRKDFRKKFESYQMGNRSKKLPECLAQEIANLRGESDSSNSIDLAKKVLGVELIELEKKNDSTKSMFFSSIGQVKELARFAISYEAKLEKFPVYPSKKDVDKLPKDLKKECHDAFMAYPSIDLVLFGRMVASDPSLNFDAAAQVAHAISTHEVHNEYDYFTAVDDCSTEDNAGAGHIGTVEYNSATLYRYAAVNVRELAENLGDDTANVVREFADTFIRSMPEGRQNPFANRTLPDAVYLTIRRDQPVNMAGAFEKPVRAGKEGYVSGSVAALAAYAGQVYDRYIGKPDSAFAVSLSYDDVLGTIGQTMSLSELLSKTEERVSEILSEVE